MERRLNEGNRTTKVEKGKEPTGRGGGTRTQKDFIRRDREERVGHPEEDHRRIEGGRHVFPGPHLHGKGGFSFCGPYHDYNPVHFEKRFARAKSLKGLICHGLLVASMISEIGGQIGWLASEMSFRFKKPVYPEKRSVVISTLTRMSEKGKAEAEAGFRDDRWNRGPRSHLKGIVPGAREKEVMKAMVAEGDQPIS